MVFSSITFVYAFFPLVAVAYYLSKNRVYRNVVLLLASLLFYSWGEPRFLLLMLAATLAAYCGGLLMERSTAHKRLILIVTVVLLVGNLFVFKYLNFFSENLSALFGWRALPKLTLPIGISFYTFQVLSYVIDVYRGTVPPQRNLLQLATYVAMFPQLIAGPIVRYADIAPELTRRRHTLADAAAGARRFVVGLGKKVLIANVLYELMSAFLQSTQPSVLFTWLYAVACALQIYFDFSGYSDMAIGIGEFFGITLPENFEYPYLACSVGEYWRRWHISLSSWFRDYVYFSLGGSRCAPWRHYLNIVIVFVCSGLWHGADWRYLAWGLFTGLLAAFGVMTARARQRINRYNPLYRMGWFKVFWQCLFTNALFCLTLVFFASAIYNTDPFAVYGSLLQGWDGLTGSWAQVSNLIYSSGIDGRLPVVLLFGCFVVFAAEHKGRSVARWIRQQVWPLRWTLYYGMAAAILFFAAFGQSAFIYQQY